MGEENTEGGEKGSLHLEAKGPKTGGTNICILNPDDI